MLNSMFIIVYKACLLWKINILRNEFIKCVCCGILTFWEMTIYFVVTLICVIRIFYQHRTCSCCPLEFNFRFPTTSPATSFQIVSLFCHHSGHLWYFLVLAFCIHLAFWSCWKLSGASFVGLNLKRMSHCHCYHASTCTIPNALASGFRLTRFILFLINHVHYEYKLSRIRVSLAH